MDAPSADTEELNKRKKRQQNLRLEKLDRQGKKPPLKPSRKAYTYRYNMRTDSEPIAVRASWGMHVEPMNWSVMGNAEYAAARPVALRAANRAQSLRGFGRGDELEIVASSDCPGAIKQRC